MRALKLLLTGAGGFLGRNLLDRLALNGHGYDEIHAVGRRPVGAWPGRSLTVHAVDLFDADAVARLMADVAPTHLCHMAWLGPEHADRYRSAANHDWVDVSSSLFESFVRAGGRRLVHLGSCIEYGNSVEGRRSEELPLAPDTAYGEAKARVAERVEQLSPELSTAVARPFFAYGPHEQEARLVSSLILALERGEQIDLTEGRQRRDYLHSADIADALGTLLATDTATGPFNIGAGAAVAVRSIAEHLGHLSGRPELLRFGARPEGADTADEIVADIGRITDHTTWRPVITLGDGLERTMRWWRQNDSRAEGVRPINDG